MENLTTYRAKGKTIGLELLFKYDLNGNLKAFEIAEGTLNHDQQKWLFDNKHFPSDETKMKYWESSKDFKEKFDVTVAPAVLNFEAVWELFGHKIKKFESQTRWNKCNEATKIKIFASIPAYKKYVERKGISQKNLASYILQRYYEDDYSKA